MKNQLNHKLEKGQMIPLVVILMFVIIGMVALILDGGSIMSNRRTAQAAADAGALAGAQRICAGEADAKGVAEYYATVNNHATSATAIINGQEVTVTAEVENPSFFARIMGEQTLTATAEAVAGCYYPSKSNRLLPIAFYYETPPINAKDADCSDPNQPCSLVNWDFIELMDELRATSSTSLPLDNIYIVAEKTKVCEKFVSGEIVCTEMSANESGGNRTWIDLNFLNNTPKNLKTTIDEGIDNPILTPAWINGQTGVNSAVYSGSLFWDLDEIDDYEDLPTRLVVLPVFDKYCATDPQSNCAEVGDKFYIENVNQASYRLVGFAPFVVTCVTMSDKCDFGQCIPANTAPNTTSKPICPGMLASESTEKNAIEGYFVEGIPTDNFTWGVGGVDVGIHIISLSQ